MINRFRRASSHPANIKFVNYEDKNTRNDALHAMTQSDFSESRISSGVGDRNTQQPLRAGGM